MMIQSISNPTLNTPNKHKINFTSINTNQENISEPVDSIKNKEDNKKELKKAYWKGVLTGILFSILAIGGDHLIEYINKKIPCKIRKV